SLPQLSEEEEEQLDKIIDRFIQTDIGKLRGDEARKAIAEFKKLGPEATFALIRGVNRSAEIEASCPVLIIGKKVANILGSTNDTELLTFARENLGAGVQAKKHMGFIKDLRVACSTRLSALQKAGTSLRTRPKSPE